MKAKAIDLSKLDPILTKHEGQKEALIPVLQEVQGEFGYVPEEAIERIADALELFPSQVYGVVTFYSQFYLTPRGRNTIRACRGTACHVRGARSVLRAVEQSLGISEGNTTEDFKFTLETVACLGACALGPVVVVNEKYFGKMAPRKVESVLRQYD